MKPAHSTATEVQINRLLEHLRYGPKHTHYLRKIGISHPAARIQDLRKQGYDIASDRVISVDSDGFQHINVALYSLLAEPEGIHG